MIILAKYSSDDFSEWTQKMNYNVIVVGAGPAGIFTAYELIKENVVPTGHKKTCFGKSRFFYICRLKCFTLQRLGNFG
ncbi:MAG: hypothetical protein WC384_15730 [Prolixibacteraceae bacterium]|jgi:ribulose 1,5-bisphosphate synthetase/thiazole synthase